MNEGGFKTGSVPLDGEPALAFAASGTVVDTQARAGSAPCRDRVRAFGPAQAALVVAGWVVFSWAWVSVMRHTAPLTMAGTLAFIGVCAALNEAVALGWIHHNLRIFARKGPRKAVFVPEHAFTEDFLDRKLDADWREARTRGTVLVTFDDSRKRYVPYRGEPTAENLVGRSGLKVPAEDEAA